MATLSDIAKIAGVGVMSVSRVVNGTRKVSKSTETKVRAALQGIDYEPNEAARMLKGHRQHLLGLIVPDLADPFFATCANAIQESAWEAGYMTLMVASGHNADVERQQAEMMLQKQLAGLIIIPTGFENAHLAKAQADGFPIVSLDRPLAMVDADTVTVDNRRASARLIEHLVWHGHTRIACVSKEEKTHTRQERLKGYTEAIKKAGLEKLVYTIGPTAGLIEQQILVLLAAKPRPTAIFVSSDLLTIGLLRELQEQGIRIPEEMAVVAFDDFDAATLVSSPVTVVRQPVAALGHEAVRLLLQRMDGDMEAPSEKVVMKTELILRRSCGCGA